MRMEETKLKKKIKKSKANLEKEKQSHQENLQKEQMQNRTYVAKMMRSGLLIANGVLKRLAYRVVVEPPLRQWRLKFELFWLENDV